MKALTKTLSMVMVLSLLAGCNIFLDGYQEEGAPCFSDADCKGSLNCVVMVDEDGEWKSCAPGGAVGEDCYDNQFCVEEAFCTFENICDWKLECSPPCPEEMVCKDMDPEGPICVDEDLGSLGQECFMGMCEFGLFCDINNKCKLAEEPCIVGQDDTCPIDETCVDLEMLGPTCTDDGAGTMGELCHHDGEGNNHCVVGAKCVFSGGVDGDVCIPANRGGYGDICYPVDIDGDTDDVCDPDLACDTAIEEGNYICREPGEEGTYCDPPANIDCRADLGLRCLFGSQDQACAPIEKGQAGQVCWRGQCEGELECMPLLDGALICAPVGTGGSEQPCFHGMCLSGFSCIQGTCVADEGGTIDDPCAFEEQCNSVTVCDFTAGTCQSISNSDLGDTCTSDTECQGNNTYKICRHLWAYAGEQRCTASCWTGADCAGTDDVSCLVQPGYIGQNLHAFCGLDEWGNYYGVACEDSQACYSDESNTYVCASYNFIDTEEFETPVKFCTTTCQPGSCPEGWDCCPAQDASGDYCAPALMCGFGRPCTDDADCSALHSSNYPLCKDDLYCTRACDPEKNGEDCPPGTTCEQSIEETNMCTKP